MNMKKYLNNLVSIIIPVYNTPIKLIERCFESIKNQSFKNLEIIIVNDGSEQALTLYCNNYNFNEYKVNIINQENQGVSAARNNGLKYANGDYIAFIDADDFIEKDYIFNLIMNAIDEDADIVFTTANKIYSSKIEPQRIYKCNKNRLINYKNISEFSPYNLDLIRYSMGENI